MGKRAIEYGRQNVHVELNVTYRCNLKCRHCNRLLDVAEIPRSDMTADHVEEWCRRMAASPWRAKRVKISGGEPRLNPALPEIVQVLLDHRPELVGDVAVCTNASRSEDLPRLPGGVGWRHSPPAKKLGVGSVHIPPLLSPADWQIASLIPYDRCSTIKHCGMACDAWGFTACSLLPILGRALGVNPYKAEPTRTPDPAICRHCVFALCWEVREGLLDSVEKGKIAYPSPSFAGFERRVRESASWSWSWTQRLHAGASARRPREPGCF